MRIASLIFATAVSCLGGVFANASASAGVFQFRFSDEAFGTFTTGAPASDPGYELITGLTFNVLSGRASFPFAFSNVAGSHFKAGAAFNPTTRAFINHSGGGTYTDIGLFELDTSSSVVFIDGGSFSQPSSSLTGDIDTINGDSSFEIPGNLTITQTGAPVLLGFAGLGFARSRRAKRRDVPRSLKRRDFCERQRPNILLGFFARNSLRTVTRLSLPSSFAFAIAAAVLATGAGSARAAVILLDVSGGMTNVVGLPECTSSSPCNLGGDVVIGNSTNVVLGADVTITTGDQTTTFTGSSQPVVKFGLTAIVITEKDDIFSQLTLVFSTPTVGSLVGYTGGPLSTKSAWSSQADFLTLISGSLTEGDAISVPEPSSLLLMLTGIAGVSTSGFAKRFLSNANRVGMQRTPSSLPT